MRLIDADRLKQDLDLDIYTTKLLRNGKSDLIFNHHISELESFKRTIDLQTTIDAEPTRHGEWKHDRDSIQIDSYCSCCGFINIFMPKRNFADMPYCPNCGAKMDLD